MAGTRGSLPRSGTAGRAGRWILVADWPKVAVSSKMLIKWRVGLTLGPGRSLMHGVAPQMCGRVANPLLDLGAGGRSPGYLMPPRLVAPGVNVRLGARRPDRRFPPTPTDLGFGSSSFSDLKVPSAPSTGGIDGN